MKTLNLGMVKSKPNTINELLEDGYDICLAIECPDAHLNSESFSYGMETIRTENFTCTQLWDSECPRLMSIKEGNGDG